MTDEQDADAESIAKNRCPVCSNWGFIEGPRGGAGQNIFCANPTCRSSFNVAPRHKIVMVHRIGLAPEAFYPPRVHILRHGQPLCGFAGYFWIETGPAPRTMAKTPSAWPIGHSWVGAEDFELCDCSMCRSAAAS